MRSGRVVVGGGDVVGAIGAIGLVVEHFWVEEGRSGQARREEKEARMIYSPHLNNYFPIWYMITGESGHLFAIVCCL